MADRSGEVESVSYTVLPAGGGVNAVHQSCKWPLATVGGPETVKHGGEKLAVESSDVAVVRAEEINVVSYCFYWGL